MRKSWEKSSLVDACTVFTDGNWIETKHQSTEGIRLVQTGNIGFGFFKDKIDKARYISEETFVELKCTEILPSDLLVSRLPDPVGKSCIIPDLKTKMITGVDCTIIRTKDYLSPIFLLYFQMSNQYLSDVNSKVTGTTRSRISRKNLGTIEIPIPPLEEQKQIVAILDQAFTAIDQAQVNIQQNIQNAQDLFQSKLNQIFSQQGEGWEEVTLGDICDKTKNINWKENLDTHFQYVDLSSVSRDTLSVTGSSSITHETAPSRAKKIVEVGDVIFATTRPTLRRATIILEELSGHICSTGFVVLRPKINTDPEWIFYYLLTSNFMNRMESLQRGASYPAVTDNDVKGSHLSVPKLKDIEKQNILIMNNLHVKTDELVLKYKNKLNQLGEVKKSLLQKAFSGELTKEVIFNEVKVYETTSPEFAANVIAFAYSQHVKKNKENTFGHVKAQKLLHLTESIVGVDLGRSPQKDAAGPNDFQHMLEAEKWAKIHKYFKFTKRAKGYSFEKLQNFDDLIAKANTVLNPYDKKLTDLIGLLVPMKSRQAEVFATVHAAWNNMILDKQKITDEAIIFEARDNWHNDKLKIPESKFLEAINDIRAKNLQPDGTAKRVIGQGKLI